MTELNERDCTKIIYDIWLTKIKGIGPVKQKELLKEFFTCCSSGKRSGYLLSKRT